MFKTEVLVLELVSIDRLSSGTVMVRKVTALTHELRNDAMETGSLISEPFLSGAQSTKVLCCLWNDISSQLNKIESTNLHNDSAKFDAVCCDIEKYFWVYHFG